MGGKGEGMSGITLTARDTIINYQPWEGSFELDFIRASIRSGTKVANLLVGANHHYSSRIRWNGLERPNSPS